MASNTVSLDFLQEGMTRDLVHACICAMNAHDGSWEAMRNITLPRGFMFSVLPPVIEDVQKDVNAFFRMTSRGLVMGEEMAVAMRHVQKMANDGFDSYRDTIMASKEVIECV